MEKFLVAVMVIAVGVISGILLLTKSASNPAVSPNIDLGVTISPTSAFTGQQQGQQQQTQQKTAQPTPVPNLLYPQSEWDTTATQAAIRTQKGDIVIQLYGQDAPKTVTNFATLAKKGYYDNLTFHRVEDWVIQGGDPNGDGTGGRSIYGDTFEDELNPNTPSYKAGYVEGVVAMANRGPNTNGSQFFILKKDTPLPHGYTIFGKVISGMDVVQQIQVGDKMTSITVE